MKLTKRHIDICIEEGFAEAWLDDEDGETELVADLDGDGRRQMIFRPSGRAWMLVDGAPQSITEQLKHGCCPVRTFKNVREAAKMASSGIYY